MGGQVPGGQDCPRKKRDHDQGNERNEKHRPFCCERERAGCGGWMHGHSFRVGDLRANVRISLSCMAECSAVSGRGYYTPGPGVDVPGRPG